MKWFLKKILRHPKNEKERYKSLALKAKKESSDQETSSSGSEDEEYAMAVRDFKKFFKRRGRFVRQPHDDKKPFWKVKEDKKGKVDQKCFKCGDLNHFISDCSKHSYNDQKAFVGGSLSNSDEEVNLKKDEICLMAQESNEVKQVKTVEKDVKTPSDVADPTDPFRKDPASIDEGIQAFDIARNKLKTSIPSKMDFDHVTKKPSPTTTIENAR
ncbi:zf-CCHC domain-containing protein [Tanacetum coccineum]